MTGRTITTYTDPSTDITASYITVEDYRTAGGALQAVIGYWKDETQAATPGKTPRFVREFQWGGNNQVANRPRFPEYVNRVQGTEEEVHDQILDMVEDYSNFSGYEKFHKERVLDTPNRIRR